MFARKIISGATRVAQRSQQLQQVRRLNVHEYQGAELLGKYGVNVPPGVAVRSLQEAQAGALAMADANNEVVVKSQILAGGRGLGTFKNGFQGGVHVANVDAVPGLVEKMLNQVLVTKQSGEEGKPVNTLYIAKKMALKREMYFAILLDRVSAGPLIIACSEGGTSIEDLAEEFPDKIIKVPININTGITDADAAKVVAGLECTVDKTAAAEQIKALYEAFVKSDCTMVEVNPLAETADGLLMAADAKLNFDDNASFRQKDLFALRDTSQEDPREVEAAKADLNYIGLDGSIGCMVNGAGLAMATMDIIQLHGGSPANFLDVGGSASEDQVVQAFKVLLSDPKVKCILVNIFGGIMKCDVIAAGVVAAAKQVGVNVPLIVRLEGTNVEAGKKIIEDAGIPGLISANDLDDAAKKAVASIS